MSTGVVGLNIFEYQYFNTTFRLTRPLLAELPGGDGVHGEDHPVVVVPHEEAGQHAGQAEGREFLLGRGVTAAGRSLQDVGGHDVATVHGLLGVVLGVAQDHLVEGNSFSAK